MVGRRFTCLDGLRGLLAVYVLVSHMAPFAGLPSALVRPFSHGEAAVDVFFILSGMVVVRSLQSFGCDRRSFLIARAARTLPAFLVVFALAIPVQPLPTALPGMSWIGPGDPGRAIWSTGWPDDWAVEIGAHLVMAHGLFPDAALPDVWVSFLGAAWSLSTEWQFYLLVALLAPLLGGDGPRRLVLALLLLGAAALLWHTAMPPGWHFSRAFLPNKAAYFGLGIASAGALDHGRRRRLAVAFLAAVAIAVCQGGAGKLAAPLVWMLCLAAQTGRGLPLLAPLARFLRSPPLLALGRVSYPIYLINEPVQKVLALALLPLAGGDPVRFAALWLPGAVLVPLAAASLLHRYIEAPGLRLGRAWLPPRLAIAG